MHSVKARSNESVGLMAALRSTRVMRLEMTSDVDMTRGIGEVNTVVIMAARAI
jgi:hypothetical protein